MGAAAALLPRLVWRANSGGPESGYGIDRSTSSGFGRTPSWRGVGLGPTPVAPLGRSQATLSNRGWPGGELYSFGSSTALGGGTAGRLELANSLARRPPMPPSGPPPSSVLPPKPATSRGMRTPRSPATSFTSRKCGPRADGTLTVVRRRVLPARPPAETAETAEQLRRALAGGVKDELATQSERTKMRRMRPQAGLSGAGVSRAQARLKPGSYTREVKPRAPLPKVFSQVGLATLEQ